MKLPDRAVQEFRELWKQSYGEDLDYETAREQAESLLSVMRYAFVPQTASGPPLNNGPPP